MGLFDRLRDAFGSAGAGTSEDDREPAYRCLQCGAGYERKHEVCSDCGSQFVAPTDPDGDGEDEDETADVRGDRD